MMTLEEKKALVACFLEKCNRYAEGKLEHYREQLAAASGWQALALQDKVSHWTAYRTFNDHTIEELETEVLDDWFADSDDE